MSTYQSFPSVVAALEAFAGGKCRRHVEIDGHVVDLVHVANERGRAAVEPDPLPPATSDLSAEDRAVWDRAVASNVRNALAGLYIGEPAEEVEYARAKPAPLCPCCLRPEEPT